MHHFNWHDLLLTQHCSYLRADIFIWKGTVLHQQVLLCACTGFSFQCIFLDWIIHFLTHERKTQNTHELIVETHTEHASCFFLQHPSPVYLINHFPSLPPSFSMALNCWTACRYDSLALPLPAAHMGGAVDVSLVMTGGAQDRGLAGSRGKDWIDCVWRVFACVCMRDVCAYAKRVYMCVTCVLWCACAYVCVCKCACRCRYAWHTCIQHSTEYAQAWICESARLSV